MMHVYDIQIKFVPSVNFLSYWLRYDAQGIELTSVDKIRVLLAMSVRSCM